MEHTVNERFNEVIKYLLDSNKASSKKQIAESLHVSPSYFTEILKGRIKISGDLIQIFLSIWDINSNYLFGISDQISVYTPPYNKPYNALHDLIGESTPRYSKGNVSPKQGKNVSPTVSPTQKSALPTVVTVDFEGNDNIVMVPVKARAGYLLGYGDVEYMSELPTYSIPKLQNGTFRAFEVDGHSMIPTVTHGDIVFAEWCERFDDIIDDSVYVIITKTDGIVIKRLLNRILQYGFIVAKSDSITNKLQYPNLNIQPSDIIELWCAKMHLGADFSTPHSIWDRINDLEASLEDLKRQKKP